MQPQEAPQSSGHLLSQELLSVCNNDYAAQQLGAARKDWVGYPELFHEVYQEAPDGRARALEDLCGWLDAVTSA